MFCDCNCSHNFYFSRRKDGIFYAFLKLAHHFDGVLVCLKFTFPSERHLGAYVTHFSSLKIISLWILFSFDTKLSKWVVVKELDPCLDQFM